LASRNEHFEIVKFLVEKGANKESKEFYCETPLHTAARNGLFEIVKYLLESGAYI
jgi:ankyrin repeat protein